MASSVQDAVGNTRPRTKTRLKGVGHSGHESKPGLPKNVGRYEVTEMLGRGAMGVVYRARDPLLDRVVAIKTINAPASLGERVRKAFLERFEREAKAAARISHPAIVTIFDVGLDLDCPYLVMEYLPGETLADRLDRERMPLPQAYESSRELAAALGCAHRQRIVHRDVKPANVLYAGDWRWKLADFGIARMPDSDLTQLGTFMGTPGYSPPEAIRDGRYTAQADVFAWGALFYELLCGTIPYEGPDTETTNRKVLAAEPPSPRQHDPTIPEPLAEVALRALAHDPARRYADGNACAQALVEAWQRSLTSGAIPVSLFAQLPPMAAPSIQVMPGRAAPPPPPAPSRLDSEDEKTVVEVSPSSLHNPAETGEQTAIKSAPRPSALERTDGLRRPPIGERTDGLRASGHHRESAATAPPVRHRVSVWLFLGAFLAIALAATLLVVLLLGKKG